MEVPGDERDADEIGLAALRWRLASAQVGSVVGGNRQRTWLMISFCVSTGRSRKVRALPTGVATT